MAKIYHVNLKLQTEIYYYKVFLFYVNQSCRQNGEIYPKNSGGTQNLFVLQLVCSSL